MTKVLITGGTGLLGSALTAAYVARGDAVHTAQRLSPAGGDLGAQHHVLDVGDGEAVARLLQRVAPDLVIHLAAELTLEGRASAPEAMRAVNVGGTANVLAAVAAQPQPAAIITASSERAYARGNGCLLTEDHPLEGQGIYGATKAEADRLTRAAAQRGLRASVLRLSNTYGPGDPITTRIVPSVMASVVAGQALQLRSAGRAKRDFLHVSDAVAAYLAVGDRLLHAPAGVSGLAFNVGTGVGHSVLELAERAASAAGLEVEVELPDGLCAESPGEDRVLDTSLIANVVGWTPLVSLDDGLDQTLAAARAALVAA